MRTTTYHLFNVSKQRTLLITLCVFITSSVKAIEVTIDGLVYDLTGVSAKVVHVADGNTNTIIKIPSTIEYQGLEYTVNQIGSNAFCNYYSSSNPLYSTSSGNYLKKGSAFSLSSTPIYRWLTTFNYAKYNSYVEKIVLPNTITTIEVGAFYNNNLTEIQLQEGITSIGNYAFGRTQIRTINLPEGLTTMGCGAFESSTITSIVIPSTATSFGYYSSISMHVFKDCDLLHTIVYKGAAPPSNWVATSQTYVPSITKYTNPLYNINSANVIPMISWNESEFDYNGLNPMTSWTNNMNEYNATLNMPALNKNIGDYDVEVPVTFTKGGEGFTVNCVYSYTINPLTLSAKVQDEERVYGDENPVFRVVYSGFVNGEDESVLTTKPTITTTATATSDVGEYPITINDGVATNYNISYEPGTLTVNKAPLTITVSNETKVYGENNPSFTLSYDGLKNGETTPAWIARPAFSTAATQKSNVGTYSVSATCEARNYDVTIADGSLTITPAPLKIIANEATRQYYEENPEFSFTCEGLIAETTDVLTNKPVFTTDANKKSDVGTYTITPSGASAKNYVIEYQKGQLMITKRPLIAKADDATRLYGDGNPAFSVTYTGFVNNENETVLTEQPSVSSTAVPTSNVGTYPITISRASAKNYEISYEQGIMTINKAPLSVIVNDTARIYGTSNPSFTLSYEGLKNGETVPEWITRPAFSTTATQKSDVGTYTVSATCEARNYDVTINDGNLNITPASLTIKANNASRLYFAENPEFTYSYRGFVNNDNASCLISAPKIDCDATIGSKAGEYVISVYGASAKNYNITYEDAMLTIDKRTLVVTPNNAERIYGEENPEFTADITGFVNNETDDVISEMPTIYTNAKQTSDVGNYEILAKDGSADNYIFTYKKGTLTIDKADQTITWEQDLTGATVGDQIELSATSSSGLTIEYVIDSDIVSPYNVGKKLYLDCLSEGTTTIKALQNGGTNYNPAVRVVKEMVISERSGTVPHKAYQDVNQDGNVDSQDVLEIYDYMQKH